MYHHRPSSSSSPSQPNPCLSSTPSPITAESLFVLHSLPHHSRILVCPPLPEPLTEAQNPNFSNHNHRQSKLHLYHRTLFPILNTSRYLTLGLSKGRARPGRGKPLSYPHRCGPGLS
eukprot:TRINITY_DN24397_c0_g2_i1.p1 TRINITY_DN24397_c0_g2~~TRINITY_DN24397_c0_g2_i1.p1  ORF type:complete len:117 (-),score=3.25 TRINITY_DN24397_c0_g2_i1:153-503(-)